jgi:hypothetical protein
MRARNILGVSRPSYTFSTDRTVPLRPLCPCGSRPERGNATVIKASKAHPFQGAFQLK